MSNKEKKIIIEKDIVWKSYNIFTSFFEQSGLDGHISFKTLTTKMVNNIDELKIFFEIIKQLIDKEKIDNYNKNSILSIFLNKKILNNKPAIILKEIKNWLVKKNYSEDTYYFADEFEEDMDELLLLINSFLDKFIIELNIIKKEDLKLIFKETIANEIEHLYTDYFLKHFFKEEKNDKKGIIKILSTKNNIENIEINKIIKVSKYKNIDLISAQKELTKSSLIIGTMYEKQEIYSISDMLYQYNQETFDSYDYVLIDYPPTINELSLNFLILSDLVIIPINDALRAFKGILDLKDNINKICKQENRKTPNMKIVFNNVKESFNFVTIEKWIQDENLENLVIKSKIKYSDAFKTIENELSSISTNPYYWRQKQAYEELIAEII